MRFRILSLIPIAILGAAACGEGEAPISAPALSWTLEVSPEDPEFWSEMEIRVEVRANRAILLGGVAVIVGDMRERRLIDDLLRLPALAEDGAHRLAGTLMKEKIGAAARLPMPDRWDWAGEDAIVPVPHLAAGETAVFTTRWHATDPDRDFVRGVIRYLPAEQVGELLVLDPESVRTAAPPSGAPPVSRGWVPARRLSALYRTGGTPPAEAHRPVSLGEIGLPSFLPCALPEDRFEELEFEDPTEKVGFRVSPPPLTLAEARTQVGAGSGSWTWFPPLSCFVLEVDGASWLVGTDLERKCPGALVETFAALGRGDPWTLELYPEDHRDRFEDEIEAFAGAGFSPEEKAMKGRDPIHEVEIRPDQAEALLDLLDLRKLQVEARRIRPTP